MISPISDYSQTTAYPIAVTGTYGSQKSSTDPLLAQATATKEIDSQVSISDEAKALSKEDKLQQQQNTASSSQTGLTDEELKEVQKLRARDQEVRNHEQAHQSAAGSLSNGGASFEYQSGPDGKRYAVGGEVSIDISKVANDPQATLSKARQIRSAALAPASPSGQDRQVAAQAAQMESEANQEIASKRLEESSTEGEENRNSSQTDFYQQIQSSASPYSSSTQSTAGTSSLDYYA
jgi:hypothetical protein